jgi:hypothetical protein
MRLLPQLEASGMKQKLNRNRANISPTGRAEYLEDDPRRYD